MAHKYKRPITAEDKEVLKKIREMHLNGATKREICSKLKLMMPQVSLALSQMKTLGYFDPSACKKVVESRYQLQVGRVRNFTLDTLTYALKNLMQQISEMPENRMRKEALKQELIEIEMEEFKRLRKHEQAVKKAKKEKRDPPILKELTEKQHRRALEIEAELQFYKESEIRVKPADVLALTAALVKLHEIEKEVNVNDPDVIDGEATMAGMTLSEAREIIKGDKELSKKVEEAESMVDNIDLEEEFMKGYDEFNDL